MFCRDQPIVTDFFWTPPAESIDEYRSRAQKQAQPIVAESL
jgi:hypothetical protein